MSEKPGFTKRKEAAQAIDHGSVSAGTSSVEVVRLSEQEEVARHHD